MASNLHGLPELQELQEALLSPPERADLDSVAQHFASIAGGARAMAQLLYDEYRAAEPGSPVRARVMEMMMRSLGKLEGKATDDLGLLTDADLQKLFADTVKRISNGFKPASGAAEHPRAQGPISSPEEASRATQEGVAADHPAQPSGSGGPAA